MYRQARAELRRRAAGFAVAWMLVLVAIIALAGGAAAQDLLFAQQLAGTRVRQQRAMAMAELGLRIGMQQLSEATAPPPDTAQLHPESMATDSLQLRITPGASRVPAGFSTGRFIERDYEIQSTGGSARNARRVLVQGVRRMEMAAAP